MGEVEIQIREFPPGTEIGPYVIIRRIPGGKGGMATVYEARPRRGGERVALKVAHVGLSDFLKDEAAFLKILDLNHPHIIKILPVPLGGGDTDYIVRDPRTNSWYFVMEYMAGGSLADWLHRKKRLPLQDAVEVVRQVGSALDAAHRIGILHLDVKPSNILFREPPWKTHRFHAVLSDFGIARPKWRKGGDKQTLTIEYSSPEQVRQALGENVPVDHRSDLYSLGVVLYEMLGGNVPFRGEDTKVMHSIVYEEVPLPLPRIRPEVNRVLKRALAKDPEMRYQSAADMVSDLEALVPKRREEAVKERRFSPLGTFAGGTILGLIVGFLLGISAGRMIGKTAVMPYPTSTPTTRVVVPTSSPTPTIPAVITVSISPTPTRPPTSTPTLMLSPTSTRAPTSTPTPVPTPTPPPSPSPTVTPAGE